MEWKPEMKEEDVEMASQAHVESQRKSKPIRARVQKACDRCRVKKSKCNSGRPCFRCKMDDAICMTTKRTNTRDRTYPAGYVEMLEQQQSRLVAGLRDLYSRLQASDMRLTSETGSTEIHHLPNDILSILDGTHPDAMVCHGSVHDSPEQYDSFSQEAEAQSTSNGVAIEEDEKQEEEEEVEYTSSQEAANDNSLAELPNLDLFNQWITAEKPFILQQPPAFRKSSQSSQPAETFQTFNLDHAMMQFTESASLMDEWPIGICS